MAGRKRQKVNVVYSTNPDYGYDFENDQEQETLPPGEQLLYLSLDRRQRKGKSVSLVEGFVGSTDDLKSLAKELKATCGTGGSVSEGNILIQGDHRDKVQAELEKSGYRVKRKGG